MARFDLLLGEDGDLLIENGDFVIGQSDDQHVTHLIVSHPGWWRQWPTVGFGATSYLKKNTGDTRSFVRNLMATLEADGYKVKNVDVSQGLENFKLNYQ